MIDCIEYPNRHEPSLLVCAGTGLMLGLMDQCERFRYCIDADAMTKAEQDGFGEWLKERTARLHMLAFSGWYCATNPVQIANALCTFDWRKVSAVYVQCHGPYDVDPFDDLRTCHDMTQWIDQVNAFRPLDPVDAAIAASAFRVRRISLGEYLKAA